MEDVQDIQVDLVHIVAVDQLDLARIVELAQMMGVHPTEALDKQEEHHLDQVDLDKVEKAAELDKELDRLNLEELDMLYLGDLAAHPFDEELAQGPRAEMEPTLKITFLYSARSVPNVF